jgi:hypothetical protein
MRLPRFRLRTLMLAVALAAILMAVVGVLAARHDHFRSMALSHGRQARRLEKLAANAAGKDREKAILRRFVWHADLHDKYARAAKRPWLPVVPDPPEPE